MQVYTIGFSEAQILSGQSLFRLYQVFCFMLSALQYHNGVFSVDALLFLSNYDHGLAQHVAGNHHLWPKPRSTDSFHLRTLYKTKSIFPHGQMVIPIVIQLLLCSVHSLVLVSHQLMSRFHGTYSYTYMYIYAEPREIEGDLIVCTKPCRSDPGFAWKLMDLKKF